MAKLSNKKLLAIVMVLSLMITILVYNYLQGIEKKMALQDGVSVIVAKTDIAPKTKITAEMVREVKVPPEYVQPGAVQSLDKVVGIVAREAIVSGEQVSERRLVREGKSVGFTGIIPYDKRAVTVAVTEMTGVAGFIKPGDYVDVIVTFDTMAAGDNVSNIIMQNILVLAVNRDMEMNVAEPTTAKDVKDNAKDINKMGTVTIAVTPDDAIKLGLAEDKGKVRLALRPYLPQSSMVLTQAMTPKDLVGEHTPIKSGQLPEKTPAQTAPPVQSAPVSYTTPPIPVGRQEVKSKRISNYNGIQVIRGTKIESGF